MRIKTLVILSVLALLIGGAAGGGYSQVVPMEDLNYHCLIIK